LTIDHIENQKRYRDLIRCKMWNWLFTDQLIHSHAAHFRRIWRFPQWSRRRLMRPKLNGVRSAVTSRVTKIRPWRFEKIRVLGLLQLINFN